MAPSFLAANRLQWSLALGALLAVAAPGMASAQDVDADEEARVHFRLGQAYYDSGRFEQAAAEFEEAYRLSARPQLLYNVFVARRDAGQLGPAIEALRNYLKLVPDDPDAPALERRLENLERLHEQQIAAGVATPVVPEEERVVEGERSIERDEETATGATEAPVEPAPAPTDDGGGGGVSVPGIVTTAAGGALIVGGVITGILALNDESSLEDQCPDNTCPPGSDAEDTRDRGKRRALMTDIFLITGTVAAVAGVVMIVLGVGVDDDGDAQVSSSPRVDAACGPTGCMGAVTVSF